MIKKFKKELEALAKKHGLTVMHRCAYCQHDEDSPCQHERHYFVTMVKRRRK